MLVCIAGMRIWTWPALLCAAVLVGCGTGAQDNFAPLTVLDNFHVIQDGQAYRSAQLDAASFGLVFGQYGIRTVVNLRGANPGQTWYDEEVAAAQQAGVAHVDIRMSANELPPRAVLLQLYDTFQTAAYPILIHCESGADRTGAASAIWRMEIRGDTRAAALQELSPAYGHIAALHPAMDQLAQMFQPDRTWIETQYPVP